MTFLRRTLLIFPILFTILPEVYAQRRPDLTVEKRDQISISPGEKKTLILAPGTDQGGSAVLMTLDGVGYPVANAEKLEFAPKDVPIPINVSLSDGKLTVHDWSLPSLVAWQEQKRRIPLEFSDLHQAFGRLEKTVAKLQETGAMSTDRPDLDQNAGNRKKELVKAHRSVQATPEAREIFGSLF